MSASPDTYITETFSRTTEIYDGSHSTDGRAIPSGIYLLERTEKVTRIADAPQRAFASICPPALKAGESAVTG